MKVFVCIKQVPDTETKIKIAADGASIDPTGVKWIVNPYDELAIEEAVKLKEKNPALQTFAITVGPKKRTVEALRTALAMGIEEAIAVDAGDYLDPVFTAQLLAKVITDDGGAHLVLSGKAAIDDNFAAVGTMVAELLGIPHVAVVSKLEYAEGALTAERDSDGGTKEIYTLRAPASLAANKGLNTPRYASLPGIMKAKKKVIKEIDSATLGIAAAGSLKLSKIELPPEKPAAKILSGDVKSQVAELVNALRNEAKVL